MNFLKRRFLSIDIGNNSFKVVEAMAATHINIIKHGLYPITTNKDSNLNLFNYLKEIASRLKSEGYGSKEVILTFNNPLLFVREFSFPKMNNQSLIDNITMELIEYLPALLKEYDISYRVTPDLVNTDLTYVMVVSCPKKVIEQYTNIFNESGLKIKILDAQANTGLKAVQYIITNSNQLSSASTYFLLDIGYSNIILSTIAWGRVIHNRIIGFGSNELENNDEINQDKFLQLGLECNRFIEYHNMSCPANPLELGILFGGGVYVPQLLNYLQNSIPLDIKELNYFNEFLPNIPDNMDLNLYANCLGGLVRGEDFNCDINLLQSTKKDPPAYWTICLIIPIIIAMLTFIKYGVFNPVYERENQSKLLFNIKEKYDQLITIDSNILEEDYDTLKSRIEILNEMENSSPAYWNHLLASILNNLPPNASITSLVCDNNTILISGTSDDDIIAALFAKNLYNSLFFSKVSMERITYSSSLKIDYQLRCEINTINTKETDDDKET